MVPSLSLVLALHAAAAMASPLVLRAESAASGVLPEDVMVLNKNGASKSWPSERQLEEISDHSSDSVETIKQSDWLSTLEAAGILLEKPAVDEAFLNATDLSTDIFKSNETLTKRQASCDGTFAVVTDTTQRFVDWDVQMSPVVCAVGDMDINVMKGCQYTYVSS